MTWTFVVVVVLFLVLEVYDLHPEYLIYIWSTSLMVTMKHEKLTETLVGDLKIRNIT